MQAEFKKRHPKRDTHYHLFHLATSVFPEPYFTAYSFHLLSFYSSWIQISQQVYEPKAVSITEVGFTVVYRGGHETGYYKNLENTTTY